MCEQVTAMLHTKERMYSSHSVPRSSPELYLQDPHVSRRAGSQGVHPEPEGRGPAPPTQAAAHSPRHRPAGGAGTRARVLACHPDQFARDLRPCMLCRGLESIDQSLTATHSVLSSPVLLGVAMGNALSTDARHDWRSVDGAWKAGYPGRVCPHNEGFKEACELIAVWPGSSRFCGCV
jgi:hypothetical protein